MRSRRSHLLAGVMVGGVALFMANGGAQGTSAAPGAASEWSEAHGARARLIAGGAGLAGVEIELQPGWKTYWRSPGDAGGVPPSFDWSGSANAANMEVLYPAPHRIAGKDGDSIGYKDHVLFPVRFTLPDAGKPAILKLALFFGICKDICVPVEATLTLDVSPDKARETPEALAAALDHVPRSAAERRPGDPVLTKSKLDGGSKPPALRLSGRFPGQPEAADLFLEAPDGIFLPLPAKLKDQGGQETGFDVDLSGVDMAALTGKTITATLVGSEGAATVTFPMPCGWSHCKEDFQWQ